jgi:hypothetical protein
MSLKLRSLNDQVIQFLRRRNESSEIGRGQVPLHHFSLRGFGSRGAALEVGRKGYAVGAVTINE